MGTPTEHRPALRWEGEEGDDAHADLRASCCARSNRCAERAARARRRPRRPGRAVHADVPRAGRRLLRGRSRSAASCCRCSPATAPTRSPTRLQDAGVKVLITADGFWRRGQACAMKAVADEAVAAVAVRRARGRRARLGIDVVDGPAAICRWSDLVGGQSGHLRDRAHRRRRSADDHLHLGHDRPAQGRGAHALRLPDQGRAGHGALLRRAAPARRCTGSATWAG